MTKETKWREIYQLRSEIDYMEHELKSTNDDKLRDYLREQIQSAEERIRELLGE